MIVIVNAQAGIRSVQVSACHVARSHTLHHGRRRLSFFEVDTGRYETRRFLSSIFQRGADVFVEVFIRSAESASGEVI